MITHDVHIQIYSACLQEMHLCLKHLVLETLLLFRKCVEPLLPADDSSVPFHIIHSSTLAVHVPRQVLCGWLREVGQSSSTQPRMSKMPFLDTLGTL
uniref:Uncharacterized protein n=1 Tax=Rhipicephalus zambeziensis TaxID=60191 RepID=A0A224YFA6_9ACAR